MVFIKREPPLLPKKYSKPKSPQNLRRMDFFEDFIVKGGGYGVGLGFKLLFKDLFASLVGSQSLVIHAFRRIKGH